MKSIFFDNEQQVFCVNEQYIRRVHNKICRLNASDLFKEWLLHKLIGFHNCNVSAISLEKCMAFGVSGNGTPYWSRKEKKKHFHYKDTLR